jgi:hypothetical protein
MLQELGVVCQLSRWASKLSNYSKKVRRDVIAMQLSTRVADSSRCIEHIINTLKDQVKLINVVNTEDNMKPISGSQYMKLGSTKAFDQCLPIGRLPDRESKLPGLMTCSGASDGATKVYLRRGLTATMAHEVGCNPN